MTKTDNRPVWEVSFNTGNRAGSYKVRTWSRSAAIRAVVEKEGWPDDRHIVLAVPIADTKADIRLK